MMRAQIIKSTLLLVAVLLAPCCVAAQTDATPTREHYFPDDYRPAPPPPEDGTILKYAVDGEEGAQRNFGVQIVHDNQLFATFMAERFEHQWREHGIELFVWDVTGWVGNDFHKLYFESEGEVVLEDEEEVEEAVVELLYSGNIDKFWDLQAGIRHDFEPLPQRTFVAFGVQGLAPQWFEIDATAYLSEDGDLSAAVEVEYELMFTQRLVLIPRVEFALSAHDVPEYGQWQGLTDVTAGARLAYQFSRKFAPYIGVTWHTLAAETANRAEKRGEDTSSAGAVAGVRFWF